MFSSLDTRWSNWQRLPKTRLGQVCDGSWVQWGLFLVRGFPAASHQHPPRPTQLAPAFATSTWSLKSQASEFHPGGFPGERLRPRQEDERPGLPHCSHKLLYLRGSAPCSRWTCQGEKELWNATSECFVISRTFVWLLENFRPSLHIHNLYIFLL